jgi:hypothetical protein
VANHQWSGDQNRRAINVDEVQGLFASTSTGHLAVVDFRRPSVSAAGNRNRTAGERAGTLGHGVGGV